MVIALAAGLGGAADPRGAARRRRRLALLARLVGDPRHRGTRAVRAARGARSAASSWTSFFTGTNHGFHLRPTSSFLAIAEAATGWAVANVSDDNLTMVNNDGANPLTYDVVVAGSST